MACMRHNFETARPLGDGRFVAISPLNHGSFGMVILAKDTLTGNDVAIKCITKPDASAANSTCPASISTDEHSEELAIHSRLGDHPNIVNLIDHFETEHHVYMVLELCTNGDLYEAIRAGKGPLETCNVRDFMLQLVSAVEHMHSKGVYHRDIKPENIFLTSNGSMKLGDFGLATTETWSTEFAVGSDRYMAPEQFDASVYGYGYSPAAADVWALGIVLLNVLFQRNPFATPTQNDPLFEDFARDRQSLFDIFPNMSQDTYSVLVHSLALDPANRSLSAVREALNAVVSFTTEDETLDDFCTEQTDVVPSATAAREPLRTPSVTSPAMAGTDSFPWSSALLKPSPKTTRQLSTIPDEDVDLFPSADWQYVDADEVSLSSNLDSGLGMSYKSGKSFDLKPPVVTKPKTSFVGSLPISFTRPSFNKSPYGSNGFSKSWSDLWDEEMEQDSFVPEEAGLDISRVSTAKPSTPQLQSIQEDGRGSVTPRQGLAAMNVNAAPFAKPAEVADRTPSELPKTLSSTILDKWAALGNFRRARPDAVLTAAVTPAKTTTKSTFGNFTPFGSNKKEKSQSRDRAPSWRQGSPQRLRSNNPSRVWQEDDDWRAHKSVKSPTPPLPASRRSPPPRKTEVNLLDADSDDGYQWDGNFRDFHL